jgi:hypothetical protein
MGFYDILISRLSLANYQINRDLKSSPYLTLYKDHPELIS